MIAFNSWYYSFSPTVANYLDSHWAERDAMKVMLYPLIGILYLTSNVYAATSAFPEFAVVISGLLASSLIGAFYLGLPLSLIRSKVRRVRRLVALEKCLGIVLFGGLAMLLVGEIFGLRTILMISSAAILLSTMLLSASVTSGKIARKLSQTI